MKIAITVNTSWNIHNFRMGLVRSFLAKGYEVVAIAPEDEYSTFLKEEGCIWYPIKMQNKGMNPLSDLHLLFQLYRLYKSTKPDIVLQYTIKPNIYGTIAASWLGIPVINNVSGLGTVFIRDNWLFKLIRTLYRVSFRHASKVFFQNKEDEELFISNKLVSKQKTAVLPGSGVNLKKFVPGIFHRNDDFIFLLIARILKDKGILEYAEAAKLLRNKGVKAQCWLLGALDPGPLGIKEELVRQWEREKLLKFIPFQADVRSFIREADCVVLPSYREGTPRTLLEAAAMQKPLIATDVPGCRDVVRDNNNGFLCQVKNELDLAEKMEKMVTLSNEELEQMGRNSRELVLLKYDEKIVISAYNEAIIKVLKEPK